MTKAKLPRILVWDIESTGLNATFGTILCIGWKWWGEKEVHMISILDGAHDTMLDDSAVVDSFSEVFLEADYHITWYGAKFDLPFVATKLMKYGMPPLPDIPHLDLWRHARYKMRVHNNRLATVSEFLDVEHSKTPISFGAWRLAALGDAPSLDIVMEHCKLDVLVLEECFDKMRPFLTNEPTQAVFIESDGDPVCPSCGSEELQSNGFRTTRTYRYRRYQCLGCGKWSRERLSDKGITKPRVVSPG